MQLTPRLRLVLSALHQSREPLSAYGLLDRLRREDEAGFKAPAQVYRALDALMELGLVHRLESLNAYTPCQDPERCRPGPTAFTICGTCTRIDEFVGNGISRDLKRRIAAQAFTVNKVSIEIHGQCPACAGRPQAGR
ncbi:Fur family transcriptional regulator [Achromobacter ruhlandii]|uniref:Zinc uptake regulation protein n=1 Tax=Achromobacter ruhlandii TaxID=72557 RepID=A0A2M9GSC5_9BURK|nr:Fur family transcriptional regulator [Achromobacter ruhlandii]PJM67462.1 transcriptional repressor [Achromobacter ruhlandii]CAB3852850.1 Zinc uptake regulation protein [Achromobacter ruhlandii]